MANSHRRLVSHFLAFSRHAGFLRNGSGAQSFKSVARLPNLNEKVI
jgi:hypothetical protein